MRMLLCTIISLIGMLSLAAFQRLGQDPTCPANWEEYGESCYRFIRSPIRNKEQSRKNCEAYNAKLVSIGSMEEHSFIIKYLEKNDPHRRKWYTSARQSQPNYWVNSADNVPLQNMEAAFLPDQDNVPGRDHLAYSYSEEAQRWGLLKVDGQERLVYICEILKTSLNLIVLDDRTLQYGQSVVDPKYLPRGPKFVHQPEQAVFDVTKRGIVDDISIKCLAEGYPYPTYSWYKEDYENDQIVSKVIDPLTDGRYTLSGGSLIINNPDQIRDRGRYHCKATNKFGSILSGSVQLAFGYIGEFNLQRSKETGNQYWGKAIYCDPPQHYPAIHYYWTRDYFPNFVEEDRRTFVSLDGNLYFSSLENLDRGKYSCNVQSTVSSSGRNGPFFDIDVVSHANYQQLKFPNNFPKAFPEAPTENQDVRLECVAFGYPVPHYNWTRRGGALPRGSYQLNYNRVLMIPEITVADEGEYVCRATNSKVSIENTITLRIQAKPRFTIPLQDLHMDQEEDLTWTCEAFGIPDVTYKWLKNGELLNIKQMDFQDADRYKVQDNVLTIDKLDPKRDEAMYQCEATNQLGITYSSAQLRVLALAPSFAKKPLERETYSAERRNVTIECDPEAAPKPQFIWRKDGVVIGAGGRRQLLPNGHLVIMPVSRADEGLYTCIVRNIYGTDQSSGRLIVLRGPHLTRSPRREVTSAVKKKVELACEARADSLLDLAYVWTHNGLRVSYDKLGSPFEKGLRPGYLRIHNLTFAEAGKYQCIVMTAVGQVYAESNLIIQGPPGPPGGVQVLSINNTYARLQWTDGTMNGRRILLYQIEGRTNWNSSWTFISENHSRDTVDRRNNRRELGVVGLSPWSSYEFRLAAANVHGFGPFSSPSPQYNTHPDIPYDPPDNVGGGGGKTGDLTIQWTPLPPGKQNAPEVYYKVFWRRTGLDEENEFQQVVLQERGNVGMHVVPIQRKYFYTEYEVKLQAWNSLGAGPVSDAMTIFSAEDMPQVRPTGVAARAFNSTSLNVTWQAIPQTRDNIRGQLIGYRIKYWRQQDKEKDALILLRRGLHPWALVVGLSPSTYYYVRVMAYNGAGSGTESDLYLERTFKSPPLNAPTSVRVEAVNPSTVSVSWRFGSPGVTEEPLIGFKIRVWEKDTDMTFANNTIVPLGRSLNTEVYGLEPGKIYNLRVLGYSLGGDGKMSSPTWEFQMGDPRKLRGSAPSQTAFTLPTVLMIVVAILC